jgi:hypothetical protein
MKLAMYETVVEPLGLPYPPLSIRCQLIVENAVRAAWELMLKQPRGAFDLSASVEDEVTHELYERLYDEIFDRDLVEGFGREVFASVSREPKVRNFDGSHLDKMPDLLVEFVDRPAGVMNSQYGLFIECKPVDGRHTVGTCYCDKGLIRFVRGDYGWAMQDAMMVGYSRKGYDLVSELVETLAAPRKEPIPTVVGPTPCPCSQSSNIAEQVVTTIHERTFRYVESNTLPGRIRVRHLWLKRVASASVRNTGAGFC